MPAAEQLAKTTPEMAKAGMDLWMAWAKKAGSAVVDLGMPLGHPMSVTMSVTPKGASPSGSQVGGFSILQGESSQAVTELLQQHPHFRAPGGRVEVLEFLPMPGAPK